MITVHLLISGKVQGVFYRASAKKSADALGIKGWVRNKKNGDVESVASGTNEAITAFINWCKKGPEAAKVKNVTVTESTTESFDDFSIKD